MADREEAPVAPARSFVRARGAASCPPREFTCAEIFDLAKAGSDWIWETDAELRFSWLSENFEEATGVPADRMLGRFRFDFLKQGADGPKSAEAHLDDLQARRPFRDFVYEFAAAEPRCRWVSVTGFPRFGAEGAFLGYRGVGRNVTSLIAPFEEALERSRLAQSVLNSVRDPIFVKDEDLNFVFVNEAFASMFGKSPQSMLGRHGGHFMPADRRAEFERSERQVLLTGEPYEVEEQFGKHGAERSRVVRKHRVEFGSGRRYVACFVFDVTEMKRRETEAEVARRRLADVLESLPAGVVIYDRDDRFVLANRKLQDSLPGLKAIWQPGHSFRDAIQHGRQHGYFRQSGDPGVDILYETDQDAWIEAYMERHRQQRHRVYERRNPDGRWFQVIDTRTDDGTFIGVRIDITEMKQREKELREAQRRAVLADRAKSEFLANMSHEIRTPMNGVLGMAELLVRSELDPKQKTFAEIIVKSGNALLTIINDILDFSKIDAGQLVLDPAPFVLAEAIEDVATLISTRAKEKDLELIVRVQPGLNDTYVGDVGRFRQIITNLVGNAVKFTDSGYVLVDASGEPADGATKIRIDVTDTGIGIPADKLDTVFEKFSQVDSSSTRRHEGTGLGLAITSRLVALMGGEIGVESTEGRGSTFWFTVTLPNAGQSRRRVTPSDVTGARILIVDDNKVNRSILSEQMASWTFDACAARSGEEGLEVLMAAAGRGIRVDCIVLDYQMPGMTGGEMARLVRATPEIADTPIVMLTSVDQSLSAPAYRDLAIEAQLTKPARSSLLLETIVAAIQKRRAHGEEDLSLRRAPASRDGHNETPPVAQVHVSPGEGADDGHSVDILVAEDNEVNQLVFTQILGETDYSFRIVANGRLALQAFAETNPRIILMDVSMPEMSGLEATAAIRDAEIETGRHVPIIGVTAHALKGDRERCLEAGMDDYLSKPISPRALIDKVERWTAHGRQTNRHAG